MRYSSFTQRIGGEGARAWEIHHRAVQAKRRGEDVIILSIGDPDFAFEAGWTPQGAACVARTRQPALISLRALLAATPRLGGRCNEAAARARGALIFTRVRRIPAAASAK